MDNDTLTRIDLLRHGECQGGEIFRGSTDVELTPRGWEQMHNALAAYSGWEHVISSPLTRCRLFAQQHAENQQIGHSIETDIRELDFGDWEGRLVNEVWQEEPALLDAFVRDPAGFKPPNGESVNDAFARASAAWDRIRTNYAGQHILIVAHGGTIRLLLSAMLGLPLDNMNVWHVPYACLSRLEVVTRHKQERTVLVSHAPNPGHDSKDA